MLHSNGALKIQMIEETKPNVSLPKESCILSDKEFCMKNCVLNEVAYAACDGSKKNNYFGRHYVVTDARRNKSIR